MLKQESGQIIEKTRQLPKSHGDEIRITQAKKEKRPFKDIQVMENFVTIMKQQIKDYGVSNRTRDQQWPAAKA